MQSRIATTILFLVATSLSAQSPKGRWRPVRTDSVEQIALDTAGINNRSRVKAIWIQRIAGPGSTADSVAGSRVMRELLSFEVDCDRATMQPLALLRYGIGGRLLEQSYFPRDAEHPARPILPDSYGEDIRRLSCAKPTP